MILLLLACFRGAGTVGETPLPDQRCVADADCTVADTLAGLDHLPATGERCEGTCVMGVRVDGKAAWDAAVERHAASVPCDREFEPCPPLSDWEARCARGRCAVVFKPR